MSPIFSSFGVCPVLWGAGSGYTCGSNRVNRNVIAVGERERSEARGQPFSSGREEERDEGSLRCLPRPAGKALCCRSGVPAFAWAILGIVM